MGLERLGFHCLKGGLNVRKTLRVLEQDSGFRLPASLTRLRSGSVLSSVTLVLRGSAPSRSLRASSGVGLLSNSLVLPPLMKDPGRDEAPDASGFSLRSLPELLRLLREGIKSGNGSSSIRRIYEQHDCPAVVLRASLTSQVFFWSQSRNSVEGRRTAETKASTAVRNND